MNIVSFGGGVNSAAMIIGMFEKSIPIDLILFADTGGEQNYTYAFIRQFNEWLLDKSLPEITVVAYTDKNGERLTLEDECLRSKALPSIAYGFKKCSLKHKIAPQDKFCNNDAKCRAVWDSGEKVNKFIGYDAGERRRVEHAAPIDAADKKYSKYYPLIGWGWSREKCAEIIKRAGLLIPGKSSCFFCPSMKKAEIQSLFVNSPELFERAITIERGAKATLKTIKGLGRSWAWEDYIKTCLQIRELENAQMILDGFADAESGCLCGAPCGCYDG
jgi:hypothetical protein